MESIRVFCPGKINLSLNVLGRAQDGLHYLDSVMQSVSLGDTVTVRQRLDSRINISFFAGGGLQAACSAGGLARLDIPENNTVRKTAALLRAQFGDFGADIAVEKNLPLAGGMGGSSVDAAAVLVACNLLYGLSARGLDMEDAAKSIGSDVNFMLKGGSARVTGTGEKTRRFNSSLNLNIIVASLGQGCNTADVYRQFDKLNPSFTCAPCDNDKLVEALEHGEPTALKMFGNALTQSAEALCGGINKTITALKAAGALNAVMTGSGSCVCGFFSSHPEAQSAANSLESQGFWAKACSHHAGTKILD